MAAIDLASTLVTGFVLLITIVTVLRIRKWERNEPLLKPDADVSSVLENPTILTGIFLVLALGFTLGAIAYVGGISVGIDPAMIGQLLIGAFGVVVVLFVLVGVYLAARARGLSSAPAVGVSSVLFGILVLTIILVRLVIG